MTRVRIPATGLRERKKRATRDAIQRAALALFLEKGFAETTTEEIARAADVSPSTLFNYFPTKEALVSDEYDPLFVALVEAHAAEEPMFRAVRNAIEEGIANIVEADRDTILARGRLAQRVPALRAAAMLEQDRGAAQLREVLRRRYGRSARFEIRVVTTLVVSAMVAAMDEWLESDGKADVRRLVKRALDTVEFGAASA